MSFTLRRLFLAMLAASVALGAGLHWAGPEGAESSAVGALALGGLVLLIRPADLPRAIITAVLVGLGLWLGWNSIRRGDVEDKLTAGVWAALLVWLAFRIGAWVGAWVLRTIVIEIRDGPNSLRNEVRRRLEAQHQPRHRE